MRDKAAELLITGPRSRGGIAVWIDVDQWEAQSAVRFRSLPDNPLSLDITDAAMLLAIMHIGLFQVSEVLAEKLGISVADLNESTSIAAEVLSPLAKFEVVP